MALVSKATPAAADSPRGVGSLSSRERRLSVAVSHARCLAVVPAGPALMGVPCAGVEGVRLVNTLCHVHAWTFHVSKRPFDGRDRRRSGKGGLEAMCGRFGSPWMA